MTPEEIKQLKEALIDARDQINYLFGNLTPMRQSRVKWTTNTCLEKLEKSIEIVKNIN